MLLLADYAAGLERNSQLCIYKDGKPVVDLWGENHAFSTAPESGYDGDTLQIVYSSTKALAAAVFALAADQGLFKYDDTVASIWPEFAQNGKQSMTIADVLRHDAGLQAYDEPFTLEDTADQKNPDGTMSRVIAAQKPWAWRDGPDKGLTPRIYHAISRGFILNVSAAPFVSSSEASRRTLLRSKSWSVLTQRGGRLESGCTKSCAGRWTPTSTAAPAPPPPGLPRRPRATWSRRTTTSFSYVSVPFRFPFEC